MDDARAGRNPGPEPRRAGRYAVLAPDWQLRGYSDRPVMLFNWRTGANHTLSSTGGYVARACDGVTDFTSPFFLPRHLATLNHMIAEGMARECAMGTAPDPRQRLRIAPNRHLPFAQWAVTGRCTMQCRHCYMDAPTGRWGEIATAEALRIIDQLERANVQRVQLTGGEALLRRDFWVLAAELAVRRIGVSQLSTNGLLVTDEVLARLRDLDLDPALHFSFDGVGTHDVMRGTTATEGRVLQAIRRTTAAGFKAGVTSSLDRSTREGILRTPEVLADAGVRSWHVTAPLPIGRWATSAAAERLSLREQAEVAEQLLRRWLALGRPYTLALCGLWTGSPGDYTPPQEPLHRCLPDDLHCGALLNGTAYIMPDARLILCPRFIDTPLQDVMPSLLEVELSAAWEDPELRRLVSVTKEQILQHNPECAACAAFSECGAGCWALAYRATGDLLARDPGACPVWKGPYRQRLAALAAAG